MSEAQLRGMINEASALCDRLFSTTKEMAPTWLCIAGDGTRFVRVTPWRNNREKDFAVQLLKEFFQTANIVRYVQISEAWALQIDKGDEATLERVKREGTAAQPERTECVMLLGEDSEAGMLMGMRPIVRTKRKRTLGALDIQEGHNELEGRFTGLLPAPTTSKH